MAFGLIPSASFHLLFPLATVFLWLVCHNIAQKNHTLKFYNRSLAVSFWEEIVFRAKFFA